MKHGESGKRLSPEYLAWANMRKRCWTKSNPSYPNYGGRGITVCERWSVYENFLADLGRKPSSKHSLDRINNDGDYEPGNCRWATSKVQIGNQRKRKPNPRSIDNRTRYWGLKYAAATLSFGS